MRRIVMVCVGLTVIAGASRPAVGRDSIGIWERSDNVASCIIEKEFRDAKYSADNRKLQFSLSKYASKNPNKALEYAYFKPGKFEFKKGRVYNLTLYADNYAIASLTNAESTYSASLDSVGRYVFERIARADVIELRDGNKVIDRWEVGRDREPLEAFSHCPVLSDTEVFAAVRHLPKIQHTAEDDEILAEARARREGREEHNRADHAAAMGVMLDTLRMTGPRPFQTMPQVPMRGQQSTTSDYVPQLRPGLRTQRSSASFGPLPVGVGNPGQRAFYAQRCHGRPDDGSSAAQGCHQTLTGLRAIPTQLGQASNLNVGGLSSDGGMSRTGGSAGSTASPNKSGLVATQCLVLVPGKAQTFRNSCSFPIQFTYCVTQTGYAASCKAPPRVGAMADSAAPGEERWLIVDGDAHPNLSYRIFACRGRLGEVLPFLTQASPPRGECR